MLTYSMKGRGISEEGLQQMIFPKNEGDRDNAFWQEISTSLARPSDLYGSFL